MSCDHPDSTFINAEVEFGLLCFIHEPDFWERLEGNKIPPSLILVMAASALRFGGKATGPEDIDKADQWAKEAGDRLLANVFNEFGATELMVSLRALTY